MRDVQPLCLFKHYQKVPSVPAVVGVAIEGGNKLTREVDLAAANVQKAYCAQARAFISGNNELIASTTGLILESRALLRRVDRQLADPAGSPPAADEAVDRGGSRAALIRQR